MPLKVEGLTKSQRVADRWYLKLEGGESIRVDTALIADFSLYPGRELSDEELTARRAGAAKAGAKARALRMLGSRMYSQRELYDKLIAKGESPGDAAEAVEWVVHLGYVDDGEYAAAIVRRYMSQGYGLGRVRQELWRRGVPKELWDEAIAQAPETLETVEALLEKRLSGRENDERERRRAVDMLRRRGFSWQEIKSALMKIGLTDSEDM